MVGFVRRVPMLVAITILDGERYVRVSDAIRCATEIA
jgi:hypothetical protein